MLVTYLFFLVFGLFFTRTFFKLQTDSEEIIGLGVQYLSICLIFQWACWSRLCWNGYCREPEKQFIP